MNLNRVTIIGNLGRDPSLSVAQGGTKVAIFSVAVTERWQNREGRESSHTEWFRVVTFDKRAEFVYARLKKGALVYVEGPIRSKKFADRDGKEREQASVHATMVALADGLKRGSDAAEPDGRIQDDDIPW